MINSKISTNCLLLIMGMKYMEEIWNLHKSNRVQKMSHGTQKGSVAGHTTFYTIKMCMKSFPYMSDIYPAVKKCHIIRNKRNNKWHATFPLQHSWVHDSRWKSYLYVSSTYPTLAECRKSPFWSSVMAAVSLIWLQKWHVDCCLVNVYSCIYKCYGKNLS